MWNDPSEYEGIKALVEKKKAALEHDLMHVLDGSCVPGRACAHTIDALHTVARRSDLVGRFAEAFGDEDELPALREWHSAFGDRLKDVAKEHLMDMAAALLQGGKLDVLLEQLDIRAPGVDLSEPILEYVVRDDTEGPSSETT